MEHLQHLFFLFLLRCRHSSHIGLPLQRWRGARGRSLGRAVRRGGCPHPQREGRQRGWLRARAVPGAGTNRHRLTGESLAVAAQPGGLSPRSAGGLSTGTSNQGLATVGRNRTCDNRLSAGLYQTELPVVARLESNQTRPFGVVTTTVSLSSAYGVRHARNRRSSETPDSWHRWGELLFKPRPVSGHRLRWMSLLLPDACQLAMQDVRCAQAIDLYSAISCWAKLVGCLDAKITRMKAS